MAVNRDHYLCGGSFACYGGHMVKAIEVICVENTTLVYYELSLYGALAYEHRAHQTPPL